MKKEQTMLTEWLNEPKTWSRTDGGVTIEANGDTDFWRHTHYGFVHDNGHFFYGRHTGEFTATVAFAADYRAQYDQAGLMLRLDDRTWIKCGVEYTDGLQHLSVVVTRDVSDWSIVALPSAPATLHLRLSRFPDSCRIDYSTDATRWTMARLSPFPASVESQIGIMCCCPLGDSLTARFRDFQVGPVISRDLHES